jgi:hypothetical protein
MFDRSVGDRARLLGNKPGWSWLVVAGKEVGSCMKGGSSNVGSTW